MRIGVVGDIHGNFSGLRQAVTQMGPIDRLFFTGDGCKDIQRLRRMQPELPIDGVEGNCDWDSDYPKEQFLTLDSVKILLTHGHRYRVKDGLLKLELAGMQSGADLIVFGHTHIPQNDSWRNLRFFNPGSLCPERSYKRPSFGIIEIDGAQIHCEVRYL
jgi:putative phosphoesterase